MRRSVIATGMTTLLACSLFSSLADVSAQADERRAGVGPADSPVRHVVIIYQENHSFDSVLGSICQARSVPCNGYTGPVTFADGKTASNIVQPDIVPHAGHLPSDQTLALANKWDQIHGCLNPPYSCVSHVVRSQIPNLARLADTFVVSDATYTAGRAASFGAHLNVASGTLDGFVGYNPHKSRTGEPPLPGWGCPSHKDSLWGPIGNRRDEPSCVPGQNHHGPYRRSPVPYTATIMERMEAAGLSWTIYQGTSADAPVNNIWSICPSFNWCYENRFNRTYDTSIEDFQTAAESGTLPNLSLVFPVDGQAQHNGGSMALGDNFIGAVVGAAQSGPQWGSTAIFITYDDCGCFYDHVDPPPGRGVRSPMVIVSPWAKPTFTDHSEARQPYSMLSFIEHNFALAPLTVAVTHAYDYANAFDYDQQPIAGPTMTTTQISAGERTRLARLLPRIEDDPT
jgi:phospholipase C